MGREYANVEDLLHDIAESLGDRTLYDVLDRDLDSPMKGKNTSLLLDIPALTSLLAQLHLNPDKEVIVATLLAGNMLYGSEDTNGETVIPLKNLHAMVEDRNIDHIRTVTTGTTPRVALSTLGTVEDAMAQVGDAASLLEEPKALKVEISRQEIEESIENAYQELQSPEPNKTYTRADASILREFIMDAESTKSVPKQELVVILEDFLVQSRLDSNHSEELPRNPDTILSTFLQETSTLSPGPGLRRRTSPLPSPVQTTPARVKTSVRPSSQLDMHETQQLVASALKAAASDKVGKDDTDAHGKPSSIPNSLASSDAENSAANMNSSVFHPGPKPGDRHKDSDSDSDSGREKTPSDTYAKEDKEDANPANPVPVPSARSEEDVGDKRSVEMEEAPSVSEEVPPHDLDDDDDLEDSFMITQTKFDYGHDDPAMEEEREAERTAAAAADSSTVEDPTYTSSPTPATAPASGQARTPLSGKPPLVPPLATDKTRKREALPEPVVDDHNSDIGSDEEIGEEESIAGEEASGVAESSRGETDRDGFEDHVTSQRSMTDTQRSDNGDNGSRVTERSATASLRGYSRTSSMQWRRDTTDDAFDDARDDLTRRSLATSHSTDVEPVLVREYSSAREEEGEEYQASHDHDYGSDGMVGEGEGPFDEADSSDDSDAPTLVREDG